MNSLDIIKDFCSSVRCMSCGEHYYPADIDMLGYMEDKWVLYTYCSSCNSLRLIVVNAKEPEEHNSATSQVLC